MHLIYVNEIGTDYKGQKQYEFIFSNSVEFDMDEWYVIPASLSINSKSPSIEYVDIVGLLKDSDIKLELIQNSDYFGVIDAVDGVISLAWENFNSEQETERLCFSFGESIEKVNDKLNKRGYQLINNEINNI
jgi:hypothetical protein